jgi:hypothetical protein
MEALMIGAGGVLAHGDGEECAVCAVPAVDDGRGGDADLGRDLGTAAIVAGGFAGAKDGDVPELGASVGVEGVDASVFGGDVEDVVKRIALARKSGCASTLPSTEKNAILPNCVVFTFAGVRVVSCELRPVRARS